MMTRFPVPQPISSTRWPGSGAACSISGRCSAAMRNSLQSGSYSGSSQSRPMAGRYVPSWPFAGAVIPVLPLDRIIFRTVRVSCADRAPERCHPWPCQDDSSLGSAVDGMGGAKLLAERGHEPPIYTYDRIPGGPPVGIVRFLGHE